MSKDLAKAKAKAEAKLEVKADKNVKITVLDNIFEYNVLAEILEENEIPVIFRSYEDSAYGDLYQSQKGWGSVWAPAEYKAEILDFLAEIRSESNVDLTADCDFKSTAGVDPKDLPDPEDECNS